MALANLVRVTTSTTGTGTLTLGSAVSGFLTPTQAGMTSGGSYSYAIETDYVTVGDDSVPTSREVGVGVWTSPTTFTRNVTNSTNSNALVSLTGTSQVIICDLAEDHRADYGTNLINGSIVASVAGNALTIAIKTVGGNDPNPTEDVAVVFRSATITSGVVERISLTAALSIVVPSTATLGVVSGSIPFRIWVVAFNEAGTIRLGVINCMARGGFLNNMATAIVPLDTWNIWSSVVIAASSDLAGSFYTNDAVSNCPFTILGFLDWATGLTTAGTWASGPTRVTVYSQGMPLPGTSIQEIYNSGIDEQETTSSTITATAATASITPTSAMNVVKIELMCMSEGPPTGGIQAEIRRGTTTRVSPGSEWNAPQDKEMRFFRAYDAPGVVTATSYTLYRGSSGSASLTMPCSTYAQPHWQMLLFEVMA